MTNINNSIQAIKAQQSAKVAIELCKYGRCHPDLLWHQISSMDEDTARHFMRTVQKSLERPTYEDQNTNR